MNTESLRQFRVALALGYGLLASSLGSRADTIYATGGIRPDCYQWGTRLVAVDTDTATASVYPPFDPSGQMFAMAAAFDPRSGALYTVVNLSVLGQIDLATGAIRLVGSGIGTLSVCLEVARDGTLYTVGILDGRLYSIDRSTGAGTAIGPGNLFDQYIMDLAFDRHGTLWATTLNRLYIIDTRTGEATFVTDITGITGESFACAGVFDETPTVMGISFDQHDRLLATTFESSQFESHSRLFEVDRWTGAATFIRSTGIDWMHGGDIRANQGNGKRAANKDAED